MIVKEYVYVIMLLTTCIDVMNVFVYNRIKMSFKHISCYLASAHGYI